MDEDVAEVLQPRGKKRKSIAIDDEIEKRKKVVDGILQKLDTADNNPNMKFGNLIASFLDDIGDYGLVEMAKTKMRMVMNEISQIRCQRDMYAQQNPYAESNTGSSNNQYFDESSGSTFTTL